MPSSLNKKQVSLILSGLAILIIALLAYMTHKHLKNRPLMDFSGDWILVLVPNLSFKDSLEGRDYTTAYFIETNQSDKTINGIAEMYLNEDSPVSVDKRYDITFDGMRTQDIIKFVLPANSETQEQKISINLSENFYMGIVMKLVTLTDDDSDAPDRTLNGTYKSFGDGRTGTAMALRYNSDDEVSKDSNEKKPTQSNH